MKANIFASIDPVTGCGELAYSISALSRVGRLALENDTTGEDLQSVMLAVAELLEIVEAMSSVVRDGVEEHERRGSGISDHRTGLRDLGKTSTQ